MQQMPQGYYPQPKKGWGCGMYALVGGLCLFGGCIGLGVISAVSSKAKPTETATTTAPVVATPSPAPEPTESAVVEVTAARLMADYSANEVAADVSWKSRRVDVTGTVIEISKGPLGGIHIALNSQLRGVRVTVNKSDTAAVARLQKGEQATFRGKVLGKVVSNVLISDATVN